jgi:hypothetical protein
MKHNLFLLLVTSVMIISCSTDENNQMEEAQTDEQAIEGSWRASEFQAANPNSSNVNLGAEILANLTAEDCYILTFTFNQDLTLIAENAVNYLEINATATGLEVPCPTQSDTEASTYTYDGQVLSIIDQAGEVVNVSVTIEGNIMTADATDLDIPNFDGEGSLIFEKF